MQDIHSIDTVAGSGDGRLFAGDGSDRRLRPHHLHRDLKCPRCESSNTKFCYYNNYNLSQPRHFCKGCRRYWTNGGVLRNVPVGGGIRKTKRSKQKSKNGVVPRERKSSNSENSSSDSSSLTAANTTAIFATAAEVSGSNSTNSTPATLINFNESSRTFFGIPQFSSPITTFDPLMSNQSSAGNLSSEIGTFTSLMTSGFNVAGDISSFPVQQQNQNPNNLQWMLMDHDQTAEIELPGLGSRRSNGGLAGTEYDQGLFDLTGVVDQSYWSQSEWNDHDHDHHLNYLP